MTDAGVYADIEKITFTVEEYVGGGIKIKDRDIAGEMFDYVEKVVLFDDVISWERDILNYKPRQLSMRELFMSA